MGFQICICIWPFVTKLKTGKTLSTQQNKENLVLLQLLRRFSLSKEILLVCCRSPKSSWWVVLVKNTQAKIWKFPFSAFKCVTISFCTWKPNPLVLGNGSVQNFCKIGFNYFCSLFTGTKEKIFPYATGLFMLKKLEITY